MHTVDWLIVVCPLVLVLATGLLAQRSMNGVADFLSARRLAGRYLLTVARGEMAAGAVVFVAMFELTGKAGFTVAWWGVLQAPVMLIVSLFGFVVYRYRETRVLTLAQFFEIRYSKRFRIFTGMLGFAAGLLNFGIIPAVGARFLVHILQLPTETHAFRHIVPTYIPLMGIFLALTLFITLSGGLITVMVTDCIEGILSQIMYLVIIGGLIVMFSWSQVSQTLAGQPAGHSMLNPFAAAETKDFNGWFVLMTVIIGIYGTMAWQNASGYNAAALTPHEGRMSLLLGRWREMGKAVTATLLAVCAVTYLQNPDFLAQSADARQAIDHVSDPQLRQQMRIPIALSHLLPIGVKGAFCAVLLMGIFGGDSTHLHSWSGILVQDVILPLRKTPLSPRGHLLALRLAAVGVAVFAFIFGALFRQTEYVLMWWQVTTAVYIGGAGAAIIGGLYWKRGTTAGAWAAVVTGSVLAGTGIVIRQINPSFPLNGQQISLATAAIASTVYVVTSLLTCRAAFNMDRMLHRGVYGVAKTPDPSPNLPSTHSPSRRWTLARIVGIDSDFSRGDKWIAGGLFAWYMAFSAIVIFVSLTQTIAPWSTAAWSRYWLIVGIGLPLVVAVVTAVWFTWGGVRDTISLFRRLRESRDNPLDDGSVIGHHNAGEHLAMQDAGPTTRLSPPPAAAVQSQKRSTAE